MESWNRQPWSISPPSLIFRGRRCKTRLVATEELSTALTNFCPISVLPIMLNFLESIVYDQLSADINNFVGSVVHWFLNLDFILDILHMMFWYVWLSHWGGLLMMVYMLGLCLWIIQRHQFDRCVNHKILLQKHWILWSCWYILSVVWKLFFWEVTTDLSFCYLIL